MQKNAFGEALKFARQLESEDELSLTARIWLCKNLEGYALITRSEKDYTELIERLDDLLKEDSWKPVGLANIHRLKGDAYRYAGLWEQGIASYREGRTYLNEPETRIFEAECLVRNNQIDEALGLIADVEAGKLDRHEFADYSFTYFYIATAARDLEALQAAEAHLVNANTPEAYFEKLRLGHLVAVKDAIIAIKEREPIPELSGIYASLDNLSRYTVLQPNFFGLGVNLNNVIDDIIGKFRRSHTIK